MTKHTHAWVEAARVFPDDKELERVVTARHPRTGEPCDLDNPEHVALLKEMGVIGFRKHEKRSGKVIFDCACGETRHVPMKKGVGEALAAQYEIGEVSAHDLGTVPTLDLIEEVPSE